MNQKEIQDIIKFLNESVIEIKKIESLTDEQEKIIEGTLLGLEYIDIETRWDIRSIKDKGSGLWKMLSEVFEQDLNTGEITKKLNKNNFQQTIRAIYSLHQSQKENESIFINDSGNTKIEPNTAELDRDKYVERPSIDKDACEAILKFRPLVRIKAPHKMGKTFLLDHQILKKARQNGFKTVTVDCSVLTDSDHEDWENTLKSFCFFVAEALQTKTNNNLPNLLTQQWKEIRGIKYNGTYFFQDYILQQIQKNEHLVLALENFDEILKKDNLRDDFCKLLRHWYELSRRADSTSLIWKKLSLIIIYATDVYGLIKDINASPFNVGEFFWLRMFNKKEIKELSQKHNLILKDDQIEQLIELIGGHPYLLTEVFQKLKERNTSLETLLKEAVTIKGIFRKHLSDLSTILKQNHDLKETYKDILNSEKAVNLLQKDDVAFKLEALGLVKIEGNMASPSINLYKKYFKMYLID